MCVFVVEDNVLLCYYFKVQLQELGYQVDVVEDVREVDYYLGEYFLDIVIVDFGLLDEDGLLLICCWCSYDVLLLVLVLIVCEGWQDKVEVLSVGVDDYVIKFFYIEEVVVCMQVLLCCNSGLVLQVIFLLLFQVDFFWCELLVNDQLIKLIVFEYIIMEILICNCGKVVSKDLLMFQFYLDVEL